MTTNVELDLIAVTSLTERYSIQRSNVYNRLSKLSQKGFKMTPEQQGGKSYLNADQLTVMDQLDTHIKAGGAISDFCPTGQSNLSYKTQDTLSDNRPMGQSELSHETQDKLGYHDRPMGQSELTYETQDSAELEMMERFAGLVDAIAMKLMPRSNVLANLDEIEKAYRHGWRLSTSQLTELLGVKTIRGSEIHRFGFTFSRAGRNGAESAWSVEKSS